MKKVLISISLFFVPLLVSAQTGSKNFIDQNYIEVLGKAEMDIPPDLIYIKIILNENESKGRASLDEIEQKMIERLQKLEIDIEQDLFVKDLASNFSHYLFFKTDIVLTKEYILTVNEATKAAEVFIELKKIDVSNVSIEKLDHTEIEEYQAKVKVLAIEAAKAKAESLASAVDQNIGRAIYIKEHEPGLSRTLSSNVVVRGTAAGYTMQELSASSIPDIEFEAIKLRYHILVRFELK